MVHENDNPARYFKVIILWECHGEWPLARLPPNSDLKGTPCDPSARSRPHEH